ncbi:N-acetylmuramoyl-L-alanine amidase [Paenibacillus sp. NEAU-GSW1]|uniref:N-acetylmuramoyl-L-alanine amidase n=1 Tax=Paenibacillus sp. NEAU-GSW1 TaxID=2682486 RepID=UPI0012E31C50|nr:N-acetylmuramoyl-L-alanine amidase [Paenibacillus sp. NEAU-GSW1]MUT67815.1 N-acetylmuramoyl-L-alanine amidase [Paenibacillus sp. NEAU-GSW1]
MQRPKLIALCDGHGMETAGKRTPTFPDGRVMKENEFNRRVVKLLAKHLERCGFKVLLVAPADVDTPLKARTDAANEANADFYVSIHANAAGVEWNSARGLETYYYASSEASKKAAEILHRHLIAGTALPNRGVKSADFHVLRETNMPAVLIEAGFMTNLEDAQLLLSEAYRSECAEELARGICEFFSTVYKREAEVQTSVLKPVDTYVNGKKLADGLYDDKTGITYVPVRLIAEALGAAVIWDGSKNRVDLKC